MINKTKGSYFEKWFKEHMAGKFDDPNIMCAGRDTPLRDFGIDSLDRYELVWDLEEKFNVSIPDWEAIGLENIGQIEEYLNGKLAEKGGKSSVAKRALSFDVGLAAFGHDDIVLTSERVAGRGLLNADYTRAMFDRKIQRQFGIDSLEKLPKTMGGLVGKIARRIEYTT